MYKKTVSDMRDEMLRMRNEDEMSNQQIADALHISYWAVRNEIGPQPDHITLRSRQATAANARVYSTYGRAGTRKAQEADEEKVPKKAVLVMRVEKHPIPLRGAFKDYLISADRETVTVMTQSGDVEVNVPVDDLGAFIDELTAIKNNIGAEMPPQFWG